MKTQETKAAKKTSSKKTKKPATKVAKTKQAAKSKAAKPTKALRPDSKKEIVLTLLRREQGATLAEIAKATDWQNHSIRGFVSGQLTKEMGLKVESTKNEGERFPFTHALLLDSFPSENDLRFILSCYRTSRLFGNCCDYP
jgi:hypothetical protein